jgi:translation elongation factor P/translation initiation factor 5A
MSCTSHNLKNGNYFYDEHDKSVYHVLGKTECNKDGHKVKFQLENFANNKHTIRTYSHDHHLRIIEPNTYHYTVILNLILFDINIKS